MKKQVTFAQSRTEKQLQKHRFSLPAETKLVKDVEFCEQRRYSTPSDHRATVHIPRGMATAPFLKHSGLTPAQREYLYSVASTYSGDRVRDIISTHYMNILHRCIRAGHTVEKDYSLTPVTLPQMVEPPQTEVSKPNTQNKPTSSKQKGKPSTAARNYGKTTLPKINKRQPRLKTPVSKQRKKQATPPKLKKKSPSVSVRAPSPDEDDEDEDWLKDWLDDDEDEEEEEKEKERRGRREEEEQSLKECLSDGVSSLSLTDWDSDSDT